MPSCQGVIGGSGTSKIAIDGTRFTAEEMEDIKEYDEILEQDKDAFEDLAVSFHFSIILDTFLLHSCCVLFVFFLHFFAFFCI